MREAARRHAPMGTVNWDIQITHTAGLAWFGLGTRLKCHFDSKWFTLGMESEHLLALGPGRPRCPTGPFNPGRPWKEET